MIVGLTGQTGAGKSTVGRRFAELGFGVIDCDKVSREVTVAGSRCLAALTKEFGASIQNTDGSLNRRTLGKIVFSDREKLERLDRVIFPYIRENIQEKIELLRQEGFSVIVLDAPTLFESGANDMCDCIVSVLADSAVRQRRIVKRVGLSEEEARRRMDSQLPEHYLKEHSDYVICNNGAQQALLNRTDEIVGEIKERLNGR